MKYKRLRNKISKSNGYEETYYGSVNPIDFIKSLEALQLSPEHEKLLGPSYDNEAIKHLKRNAGFLPDASNDNNFEPFIMPELPDSFKKYVTEMREWECERGHKSNRIMPKYIPDYEPECWKCNKEKDAKSRKKETQR